jgi:hypothetical protein
MTSEEQALIARTLADMIDIHVKPLLLRTVICAENIAAENAELRKRIAALEQGSK